jgi:purine-binding chemotaxis protein CheW
MPTPDDILNSYLDDLLGGEDPLGTALEAMEPQITPLAANAGSARVVPLPAKKPVEKLPEDKPVTHSRAGLSQQEGPVNSRIVVESKAAFVEVAAYVEPETIQTQEQKLKLEKLLQSAHTQLLVETPVVTPAQVDIKSTFINNPGEIQDWVVETPITTITEVAPDFPPIGSAQAVHFRMEGLEWLENGRPQWAQSRFDVLLFQVSGLTLAVPLIALGQIQPLTDELTPLFGQADWFMGLQPTPAGKIRTVNTARFVMPERYDESFLQTAKYVISINGVPWGLAVDSVNQPITLVPEDVKWRSDRSKRPWLAGTVKDHMCALLDIPRIGQLLIEADKNFVSA